MPTALIVGAASQDGSYLAQLLISKQYRVIGTVRKEGDELSNISGLVGLALEQIDLSEPESLQKLIPKIKPDEIYNLAAMTVPAESWDQAALVGRITGLAPVYIMESIRKNSPGTRFFQASSREIFGNISGGVAVETTPLNPGNPYAAAKAYAHTMVNIYRQKGIFAVSGIMFNHESPRRPPQFVTRKITSGVAAIKVGRADKLVLGDLDSSRDRGFAGDFVEAMWLMLQNSKPRDYIIAAGELYSVREICKIAFSSVGLDWQKYVVSDPSFISGQDTATARGDSSLIRRELGWQPKMAFPDLIKSMVDSDIRSLSSTSS